MLFTRFTFGHNLSYISLSPTLMVTAILHHQPDGSDTTFSSSSYIIGTGYGLMDADIGGEHILCVSFVLVSLPVINANHY